MTKPVSESYPELYHYTGSAGLEGILESQSIWATHYAFLNDSEEITRAKRILLEYFTPVAQQFIQEVSNKNPNGERLVTQYGGVEKVANDQITRLIESFYKAMLGGETHLPLAELFISSFCFHKHPYIQRNGLLSQWRGYGREGGYAIVFKTAGLERLLDAERDNFSYISGSSLIDVFYDDDEKPFPEESPEDLKRDLEIFNDALKKFFQIKGWEMDHEVFNEAFPAFARCILRIKNYGFHEENEVRIAAITTKHTPQLIEEYEKSGETLLTEKPINFSFRNGLYIPYINLFSSSNTPLPIDRIIVGPHKDRDLRRKSLELRLKDTGIKVLASKIPYIN